MFIPRAQLIDDRVAAFDSLFKIVLGVLRDGDDTPAIYLADFLGISSQSLSFKQKDVPLEQTLPATSICTLHEKNRTEQIERTDGTESSNRVVNFFAAADVADLLHVPSWLQWS